MVYPLRLAGQTEWHAWRKSGVRPVNVPSHPNDVYKHDGWEGWGHWLGTMRPLTITAGTATTTAAAAAPPTNANPTVATPARGTPVEPEQMQQRVYADTKFNRRMKRVGQLLEIGNVAAPPFGADPLHTLPCNLADTLLVGVAGLTSRAGTSLLPFRLLLGNGGKKSTLCT